MVNAKVAKSLSLKSTDGDSLYGIGDCTNVIGIYNEPVDHIEFTWDVLHIFEILQYIDEILIEPNSIS